MPLNTRNVCIYLVRKQGYQIRRIFAYCVIVYYGSFFITGVAQGFLATFFHRTSYVCNNVTKHWMG
jgi:hypothetical protein